MCTVFILAAVAYSSDVYTWDDNNGALHFSDDPSNAPAKRKKRSIEPISTIGNKNSVGARARILGVFSNDQDGFNGVQLVVREDGHAFLGGGVVGVVGDWSYNEETLVLTLKCYDWESDKEFSIKFKFDPGYRYYLAMDDRHTQRQRLNFVTKEISKDMERVFREYPEKVNEARQKIAEAKRRYEERHQKTKP